jgi:hypothetical protein
MNIPHNQTDTRYLERIEASEIGRGLFLVGDFTRNDRLPLSVQVVHGLTYPRCVELAEFALAFKWFPENVASAFDWKDLPACTGLCSESYGCRKLGCWCVVGSCERIPIAIV